MELRKMNYAFGTSVSKSVDRPMYCPHCGIPSGLTPVTHSVVQAGGQLFCAVVLRASCCEKYSFSFYLTDAKKEAFSFIGSFPRSHEAPVKDSIVEVSPRFVSMYRASSLAESDGSLELAGSGYRNALEILIKDYAIHELGIERSEVAKKSLFEAIDLYLPDEGLKKAADVVRIIGNDLTHFERRFDQYGVDIIKSYLDIFMDRIHAECLLKNPPVSRQKN